jgi:endonuclease YncB( thermonuclease family)
VTRFVDGDTIHCGVDLGMDVATQQTLRFYGINAPEMSTAEGKVSSGVGEGLVHRPRTRRPVHPAHH